MVIFQGVGKVFEEAGIRGGGMLHSATERTCVCACVYTLTGNMSI